MKFALLAVAALAGAPPLRLGYEAPSHIDGCQSADGRFAVTAEMVSGKQVHGPFQWKFVWKDTKEKRTHAFDAQGVQRGQIYAQLFMAPDGETFALFNHVTLWSDDTSKMHGPPDLPHHLDAPEWRESKAFSRRLIVYRKDGSILKELGVGDFLRPDEWGSVGRVFNRVHWIKEYPGLNFKKTPRPAYAFCQVSPDYTILEFRVVPPRASKDKSGRAVRVSLIDGRVLGTDETPTDPSKVPVRPFRGGEELPPDDDRARESYVPSLDPVRSEGTFREPLAAPAPDQAKGASMTLELVKEGYQKADTPAWLPAEKCLLFTDLDQAKLFRVDPPDKVTVVREEACRAKAGPDGRLYGVFGGKLASWRPGEEPRVILEKASEGREISLNDLAVSSTGFLYFTTLKDPDKGRLSVVSVEKKTVSVAFEGEAEQDLANPNGVALSADGKFLYVGISNYKNRKASGVYRFPLRADGSVDVAAGKAAKWAPVAGPDGLALGPDGHLYFTAGAAVHVFSAEARPLGTVKIPKESGTNLAFGGEDGRTLFVTTNKALYSVRLPAARE